MKKLIFIIFNLMVVLLFSQNNNFVNIKLSEIEVHNKKIKKELESLVCIPSKKFKVNEILGDSISIFTSYTDSVSKFYISPYEVSNGEYKDFIVYVKDSIKRTQKKSYISTKDFQYKFSNGDVVNVVPDMDCWKFDAPYSYNLPMAALYFTRKEFDNFPVVGVSLKQALAYCSWKSTVVNKSIKANSQVHIEITLPKNVEWEAAAPDTFNILDKKQIEEKTVLDFIKFVNMSYAGSKNYGFSSNYFEKEIFDPTIPAYAACDGAFYTVPVKFYLPDKNNLYNIFGNVAEWTLDTGKAFFNRVDAKKSEFKYDSILFHNLFKKTLHEQSDILGFSEEVIKMNIVKGGSWNTSTFFAKKGINEFYYPFSQKSLIGFRYVLHIKNKY